MAEERQLMGGFSKPKEVTDTEQAILESVKQTVSEREGKTFTKFNAISYKSQVVAGTNYNFKVETDDGLMHIKVFKPLPHTNLPPQLQSYETNKTLEDLL